MNQRVACDMKDSTEKFLNIVYPRINHLIGYGRIIACENAFSDELRQQLDMEAGTDFVNLLNEGGIRLLATRILKSTRPNLTQRYMRNYNLTEYSKRMNAILNNKLYPNLTIQGNVSVNREFMFAVVIKTVDLYEHLYNNQNRYNPIANQDGSSSFISIPFEDLGNKIMIVRR